MPSILLLHTGAMISAVLLVVFAAGLQRHLAARTPAGSLLPQVGLRPAGGLGGAADGVRALTTEFVFRSRIGLRFGAVPGWLAWTSIVLGGLTTLTGVSPLQYMAGMTGPLWLTIIAVALALLRRD